MDHIDIYVDVRRVPFDKLATLDGGETSAVIRARVEAARVVQAARFASLDKEGVLVNAGMEPAEVQDFCHRSCPSGAPVQANWVNLASASPSRTLDRVFFGRVWLRAASIPAITHFSQVRSIVRGWALNALAVSASFQPPSSCPSSAINRIYSTRSRRIPTEAG